MKFVLIIGILVLIMGFAGPIIGYVFEQFRGENTNYGYAVPEYGYGGGDGSETLDVDGVEITPENPFYYEVHNYVYDMPSYLADTVAPEVQEDAEALRQVYADFFSKAAKVILTHEDYRTNLIWQGQSMLAKLFVLKAEPENKAKFEEAVNTVSYVEDIQGILELPAQEKTELIEKYDAFFTDLDVAIQDNDFNKFVSCMITVELMNIDDLYKNIEIQEKAVIENPDLEESANAEIERLKQRITMIQESTIPTWEYRRDNEVYPNTDDWRNEALNEIEYANYRISDADNPMTEENFDQDFWTKNQYGTYAAYLKSLEAQKQEAQNKIIIAENSLESGKPDMKFAREGSRNQVNSNLVYAIFVAFLGILIGGYLIATEFQSGTVRLLMIRPITRAKVYASKYLAGLSYIYIIYLLGMILNIIVNGIINGFADYGNPNYTVNGPVNFWGMMFIRILACSVSIIFAYSLAYGLSAVIRNAAIAIALPSAAIFGGIIVTSLVAYSKYAKYLAFTPLPYLNMSSFYSEYGVIQSMIQDGINVSVGMGVVILLILSAVFYVLGTAVFRNTDITN